MEHPLLPRIVADLVDAIPWPAFLVNQLERVIFTNEAARVSGKSLAQWTAGDRSSGSLHTVRRRQIGTSTDTWWLVMIEKQPTAVPEVAERLSPRMRQLADLLANACSDKEIAQAMGLTLSSTRSYVRELYRQLSIHSRSELTRIWLLAG